MDEEESASTDILPVTISVALDFDPVEFQVEALRTITTHAYAQWISLSDDLREKLIFRLVTSVLRVQEQVTATTWANDTLSASDMENFREGARMKLLIGAYDEFKSSKKSRKGRKKQLAPDHLLRPDIMVATNRLTAAMTQLTDWAKTLDGWPKNKRMERPKQQKSLVTFTFSSSVPKFKSIYRSLGILDRDQQGPGFPVTKKIKPSQLDENCNNGSSPRSSSIWKSRSVGATTDLRIRESPVASSIGCGSSEISSGEIVSPAHPSPSSTFPLCPSDKSAVSLGDEVRHKGHRHRQLNKLEQEKVRLDSNQNKEVTRKSHKRTREEAGHVSSNPDESSSGSWVTVGSSSSSSPEDGRQQVLVTSPDHYNGDMDALEMGEYLKEYKSQVRRGSRLLYAVFFGVIFITLVIAGILATIIVLVRIHLY